MRYITKHILKNLFIFTFFSTPLLVYAQVVNNGIPFGLGAMDLPSTHHETIQWIFRILLIVAVVLIIYGIYLKISARILERQKKETDLINKRIKRGRILFWIGLSLFFLVLITWGIYIYIVQQSSPPPIPVP